MPRLLVVPSVQQAGQTSPGQPRQLSPVSPETVKANIDAKRKEMLQKVVTQHSNVGFGFNGIKDLEKPFLQPFSMLAGKDFPETAVTPAVKSHPSPGEAFSESVSAALWEAPVEKIAEPLLKPLAGLFKGALTGVGEVMTGVEKGKLSEWFNLAKNNPGKLQAVKEAVASHPQEPFLGFAQKISSKISSLKEEAQTAWKTAAEKFKAQFPETTFDLSSKTRELNQSLESFGLKLKQAKDKAGSYISDFVIAPKGKLNPFSEQETKLLQGLVDTLKNAKDYSVDDLLAIRSKFDSAYNAVKYTAEGAPTKYHAAVMAMKDQAEQFIDGVLPKELKAANGLYRDYHEVFSKIGTKIMDATGNVKQGAETYLGNLMNLNKGAEREKIIAVSKKLGIDILDTSKNIKTAKELASSVPSSVKNRTWDVIRGIISSKAFGGGAAAGSLINPAVGVPALILNIMSSPNSYAGLIEAIAGASRKLPVGEIISKIPPSEMAVIRQMISTIFSQKQNIK